MRVLKRQRLLAGFVLGFLCLNVGGVLCLTYCSQLVAAVSVDLDAHLSEHCRQAKKDAEEKNRDSSQIDANEASCCLLPIAMFSAPVEKRSEFAADRAIADSPVVRFGLTAPVLSSHARISIPVYRPPPLDRRGERILHSVIRI